MEKLRLIDMKKIKVDDKFFSVMYQLAPKAQV